MSGILLSPPPTYASPVDVDKDTDRMGFSPVWLKWFLDLSLVVGGVGSAGTVNSYNGRNGVVTETSSDVTSALGFTPSPISNPHFTGIPTAATAAPGTNTTQLATTAFVISQVGMAPPVTNSISAASGTTVTIFSLSPASPAVYLVSVNIGTVNDTSNYSATAIVIIDGTSARLVTTFNATLQTITLSGLNIQSTQTSGGTKTIYGSALRIN